MATVVMTFPLDGSTYGTQANGALVPFTATGFVDVAGQIVTIYENATNTPLGSASASLTPQPSGAYAGWYPWSILILSWVGNTTVAAPAVTLTCSAGGASITGVRTAPYATLSTTAADIPITTNTTLGALAASGTAEAGSISQAALLSVPNASATTSASGITIFIDTTAPTISTFTATGTASPITISFSASDNVAVTGWWITETATNSAPTTPTTNQSQAAGDTGWLGSVPTTFTTSSTGTIYLWGFAKDAAGNVTAFGTGRSVTISGSQLLRSDNFNRASLGSDWAQIGTVALFTITGSSRLTGVNTAGRWARAGDVFGANQFSEVFVGTVYPDAGVFVPAHVLGPVVRCSTSAQTFYTGCVNAGLFDGLDPYYYYSIWKCVAGAWTQLNGIEVVGNPADGVIRIEIVGSTLTLKTTTTHGGTYTSQLTATDTVIASGYPGLWTEASMDLDDWFGGDI